MRNQTLLGGLATCCVAALVALAASCSSEETTTTGSGGQGNTGLAPGGSGGAGAGLVGGSGAGITASGGNATGGWGQAAATPTVTYECQGHLYQCGNLADDDLDGLVDSQDPDCLGPCDNTEDSFYGGIPGQAGPDCSLDCYFDQDSGSGNDNCYWDHRCDPLSVDPSYYPEPWNGDACAFEGDDWQVNPIHKTCVTLREAEGQSDACLDFCLPLVPNGCDCFGCCELPAESGEYVWLGSEGVDEDLPTVCSLDAIDDPTLCHPCTPVVDCANGCGHCEICVGKPFLPPDCFGQGGNGAGGNGQGGGSSDQCEPGVQPCGLAGQDPCPPTHYCITGCCRPIPT